MISFGPWQDDSQDAADVRTLLARDDIWEPQRRDGDDKSIAATASFPAGTFATVFREEPDAMGHSDPFGYILFTPHAHEGVYEQHTAFIADHRGAAAMRMIELALSRLFIESNAIQILTYCPGWHPASSAMARKLGGSFRFKIDHFANRDGKTYHADVFGMTILDWAYRAHPGFAEIGHRWHEQVFQHLPPHHNEDQAHDGFLGLALKVGERRPIVGIEIYNSWAAIAQYAPAKVIWADGKGQSIIDIGEAVVVNLPEAVVAAVLPKCPPLQPSRPPPQP